MRAKTIFLRGPEGRPRGELKIIGGGPRTILSVRDAEGRWIGSLDGSALDAFMAAVARRRGSS